MKWLGFRLLPLAFQAFQSVLEALRHADALFPEARRRRLTEAGTLVAQVWHVWHAKASWGRRLSTMLVRLRRSRVRFDMQHWRKWSHAQRQKCCNETSAVLLCGKLDRVSLERRFRWWIRFFRVDRNHCRNHFTIAARQRLALFRWTLARWDEAVRISLRADCESLAAQVESMTKSQQTLEQQRSECAVMQREGELARLDLACEVKQRTAYAQELHERVMVKQAENTALLTRLEEERDIAATLASEVERCQAMHDDWKRGEDSVVVALEAELKEALDVQGSLRISLLRSEAEAERYTCGRDTAEARVFELQQRLEGSRRAYAKAMDTLDSKAAALAQEGRDAEQVAQRLEKALDSTIFRVRMCDLELQRW